MRCRMVLGALEKGTRTVRGALWPSRQSRMGLAPTGLAGALALQQQVAVPQVVGAAKGVCLANAPAQGVVTVVRGLGDAVAADLGTAQLVGGDLPCLTRTDMVTTDILDALFLSRQPIKIK